MGTLTCFIHSVFPFVRAPGQDLHLLALTSDSSGYASHMDRATLRVARFAPIWESIHF